MVAIDSRVGALAVDRERIDTAFIVGPARSGTTLLYKVLCLHPEVAYISNWRSRFGWSGLAALNRTARRMPARARRAWFGAGDAYAYGRRRASWERLFPAPVEGEPVYTRAGVARPGGPPPASVDAIVALPAAFDTIRSLAGGSCLVSKRIANNLRIPQLHAIFPTARFVFLVRDGRAVARSLARVDWWERDLVWWYGGTPAQWRAEGRDPWEMCARNWVEELDAIEAGLEAVPAEQVIRLRYEDLVREPAPAFDAVAAFLGLPDDPVWRRAVSTVPIHDRNEAGRGAPDGVALDTITAVQRDALARYGYDA